FSSKSLFSRSKLCSILRETETHSSIETPPEILSNSIEMTLLAEIFNSTMNNPEFNSVMRSSASFCTVFLSIIKYQKRGLQNPLIQNCVAKVILFTEYAKLFFYVLGKIVFFVVKNRLRQS